MPRAGHQQRGGPVQPHTRGVVAEVLWSSRGSGTEVWDCQVSSPVSDSSREGLDVTVPALSPGAPGDRGSTGMRVFRAGF